MLSSATYVREGLELVQQGPGAPLVVERMRRGGHATAAPPLLVQRVPETLK